MSVRSTTQYMDFLRSCQILAADVTADGKGHRIAAGDIAFGPGAEVFLTYNSRTVYYSYGSKGWHPLVLAPLRRIVSGRFTGGQKDDLIVTESNSGNILLYKSSAAKWELLIFGGQANAMTALR